MAAQTVRRAAIAAAATLVASIVVLVVCVRLAFAASLPDHRAYEMVSDPSKNGADVVPNSPKTVSAVDGNGVAYVGLGAFGATKGTSTDVQYVARRTGLAGTNGWTTAAVSPPGQAPGLLPLVFGAVPSFEGFTPDLRDGVYRSWKSLTNAPNVAGVMNVYRLHDIEAAQSPADLLSASPAPLNPSPTADLTGIIIQNRFDGASSDLRHVILQSPWNLTGDGSFNSGGDLYEQVQGVGVRRVGRIPSGASTECDDSIPGSECVDSPPVQAGISVALLFGNSQYAGGMISQDGSRILFQGPPGAPTGPIYMREDGVRTFQINASERHPPEASPSSARLWAMSADGTRVFFTTSESLVDDIDEDSGGADLYMYDRTAPAGARLTLISQDTTGDSGVSVTSVVGTSTDGHYVYFVSDGQIVPDAPPSPLVQGLYLWHDGQIRYIGSFDDSNLAALNTPATSWETITFARTSRVTPDGRHLLFMSKNDDGFRGRGGYRGYDHGQCLYGGAAPCRELYLYSADSGSLACVSCNPLSPTATGDALTDILPGISASIPMQHSSHALSDDGQHVFFSTTEGLVTEDTNGKSDAYEYDTATGTVHLISTGTSSSDSYFMDASPDGSNAFILTRQRLVGWDTDDNYDLYDARINGGFPDPPAPAKPCAQDGCRPPATPTPTTTPGASTQFTGPGDTHTKLKRHAPHCKKGTVLKTIRHTKKCVKPKKKQHKRRGHAQRKRARR